MYHLASPCLNICKLLQLDYRPYLFLWFALTVAKTEHVSRYKIIYLININLKKHFFCYFIG